MNSVDASNLSIEELKALIKKKKAAINLTSEKVPEPIEKRCSFTPTRSNQPPCSDRVVVSYGKVEYCQKHKSSVQGLKAKREFEEATLVAPPPTPEPVVVAEAVKPPVATFPEVEVRKVIKEAEQKVLKELPPKKARPTKSLATPTIIKKKITPNRWGRYEDVDTRIVFDPDTKAAYGVQDHRTGGVLPLTKKHIEICEKYHWKYNVIKEKQRRPTEPQFGDASEEDEPSEGEPSEGEGSEEVGSEDAEEETETCTHCGNEAEDCVCVVDSEEGSEEVSEEGSDNSNEEEEEVPPPPPKKASQTPQKKVSSARR